jgi:hypothetical protein
MSYPDMLGIVGDILTILMYFLLQINYISSKNIMYSFVNFVGSVLIVISLLYKWNLPSFIINFFWAILSLLGVFISLKRKKENSAAVNN